MKVAVMEV